MLSDKVSLGNIENAEAFVRHCLRKGSAIRMTEDQREELIAEGLLLLCELWQRYEPERDKSPSGTTHGFYGYALYLLPRKLADVWHRSQPHHVVRTQADGSRIYEYLKEPKSLSEHLDQQRTTEAYDISYFNVDDSAWRWPGDFVPIPCQEAA